MIPEKAQIIVEKLLMEMDAWIFDLDGTLVDSFQTCHEAMNAYLRRYGASVTAEWNRAHFAHTIEQVLFAVAHHCGFEFERSLEEEVQELEHLIVSNAHKTAIYPGAIECLTWLRDRGFRVGLLTAGSYEEGWSNVGVLQRAYGRKEPPMVDVVVTNGDVSHPKPHRESLEKCCEAWGLTDVSRLVYVGDAVRDILMMKQDSVRGHIIYVETTAPYGRFEEDVPLPDLILPDVNHLYQLFLAVEE